MGPPPWSQRDSYRPHYEDRGPPEIPQDAAAAMYHFRGHPENNSRRPRGRRDFPRDSKHDFSFRSRKISERPLLRDRSDQHEERVLGIRGHQDKFRDVDNLTDSDEAEMEDSEDDDDGPVSKRQRLHGANETVPYIPKWSNPDPYTSLPAPNDTTGKRIDVVKMIRKARQDVNKAERKNSTADDFISLSMDAAISPSVDTSGRSTSARNPDFASRISYGSWSAVNGVPARDEVMVDANATTMAKDQTLGKRKRHDDASSHVDGKSKKGGGRGGFFTDAAILEKWRVIDGTSPTPWLRREKAETAAIALHKEILDFYDWVKPQDYEFAVRADCISRLTEILRRHQSGELKAFGSYGAGLFLPTGDMDLVFLDSLFLARLRRGARNISYPLPKQQFRHWVNFIRGVNIAKPGSIVPIMHAKVPIIKFVDRYSGLKIDLSFNNDTGLVANETFQKWRASYPAMPILVSVVKQYLMMRGLNDVSTGGLGGFSTICLVTSVLQHLPNTGNPRNLGEVLLEFFNVYGNLLDRDAVAIRLDPPGYIDKASYGPHLYNKDKKGRLTIIDPHRPENNISGGSGEIQLIAKSFSQSFAILNEMFLEYADHPDNLSFLKPLVGGGFDAYSLQRNVLYSLHMGQPNLIAPPTIPLESLILDDPAADHPSHSHNMIGGFTSTNSQNTDMQQELARDVKPRSSSDDLDNGDKIGPPEAPDGRLRMVPNLAQQSGEMTGSSDEDDDDDDEDDDGGGAINNQPGEQVVSHSANRSHTSAVTHAVRGAERASQFKRLRPELAHLVGETLSAVKSWKIGGYNSYRALRKDFAAREQALRTRV